MFACSRFAWTEFRVGFSRRSTGAPGVRDFVALAAFFGLMTFLILLAWGVRDGLWGRIEQVLLGALPHGRAPVRLSYHIDNTNKINANVLAAFAAKFPDLTLVPHRTGDGGSGALILPGLAIASAEGGTPGETDGAWERSRSDKRVTPFRIEALPLDAPMWQWIRNKVDPTGGPSAIEPAVYATATPLVVALNRHLFAEHFNYDKYRDVIARNRLVPCDLKRRQPERVARLDDLQQIILEVKENIVGDQGKRSTVPSYQAFRVLWVDSFPTPEPTAMIVPLSTYELLLAAAERQTVDLLAENVAADRHGRFVQLRLAEVDLESDGIAAFTTMAKCLGAEPVGPPRDEAAGPAAHSAAQRDICAAPSTSAATAPRGDAVPVKSAWSSRLPGSCEQLRNAMPIRYPRFIDNGQDLLVCSGEHRRLRGLEVSACAAAAGLPPIAGGTKQLGGRLTAVAAPSAPKVEWIGASRVAVTCGALGATDLAYAKALRDDAVAGRMGAARIGQAAAASVPSDDAWIEACEAFKAQNPADATGGPPATLTLLGYVEVTIYPPDPALRPSPLAALGDELGAYVQRGFSNPAPVVAAVQRLQHAPIEPTSTDAGSLDALTKALLAWETNLGRPAGAAPAPVFRLDPSYESALVRFGVLSLILDKVSIPLAVGGLALYLFLTTVILSTAIDHRRRQYGLLLMTGITPRKVGYIVRLQIILSCLVGGAAGYVAFHLTAGALDALLLDSAVIADARRLIGLDVPSFLPPVGWVTFVALWLTMVALAVTVGTLILMFQGITTAKAPIDLVKS